ncbi:hypothetical protein [Microcoleus sp. CAWBG640]
MLKLVDPTLNLFSYTLKQGLGVGEPETRKVYRRFLDDLSSQLQEKLTVSFTPEQKQKFLALQKNKERLVSNYNQIVEMRNTSRLNLQKLMDAMGKLSQFTIDLNYLEFQYSTIKVNLEKYEAKLVEIKTKARLSDDLRFLQDFFNKAEQTYPKQIQKDIDNFRPCLEILQSLTDTIRGTVEIRKAESDRTFQTAVGILGVGLSTGGTVASVASATANFKTEIAQYPKLNFAINMVPIFSPGSELRLILGSGILSALAASLVTAIIIGVWLRIFRR